MSFRTVALRGLALWGLWMAAPSLPAADKSSLLSGDDRDSFIIHRETAVPISAPSSLTVAQLSDPQLGMTDYREDLNSFEQAVKQINLLNPDFVALCGDLVQTTNETSLLHSAMIRASFTVDCYCVPGNHDLGNTTVPSALALYRRKIGADYYAVQRPGYRFLMLDMPLYKWPAAGETEKETAWLKAQLAQAKTEGEEIYAVGHYPLFSRKVDESEGWQSLPVPQRRELLALFHQYGVRGMITGHTHGFVENRDGNIWFVSGEATSKNVDGRPLGFRFWHFAGAGVAEHKFMPLYKRVQIKPKPPYDPDAEKGDVAACRRNLRMIDALKEAVGMASGLTNGQTVAEPQIALHLKGGLASLKCPGGGAYTIGALGVDPACSIPEHQLPYLYQFEEFQARAALQKQLRTAMIDMPGP